MISNKELEGHLNLSELEVLVKDFVAAAGEPALLDPGEEPIRITAGQWELNEHHGRLLLGVWDSKRNLVRRITGLQARRRDRLILTSERFPKLAAELQVADLAAPAGRELERRTSRGAFRERFHLILAREFAHCRIEEVTMEADLEWSLSSTYARAWIRSGSTGFAVAAAPPEIVDGAGIVPAGLLWLDYLRRREKSVAVSKLILYVPGRAVREVVARAAWVNPAMVCCEVHGFDERDRVAPSDFLDAGNVDSTLPPCTRPVLPNSELPSFDEIPGATRVEHHDGSTRFMVRGLEFARWTGGKLTCGITHRRRADMRTLAAMGLEIARLRTCDPDADRLHPLYQANPEGWLESQVRLNPGAVDASLCPTPIYGQVPVFNAVERGVIDLLGIDHTGRIVVIELKASADFHLPFQALDYWVRVQKHLAAGDFERMGYFSGRVISREAPRILLIAPALEFHSTSETLIGALRPGIEILRIGLAADWRRELRVMFRLRGSERP